MISMIRALPCARWDKLFQIPSVWLRASTKMRSRLQRGLVTEIGSLDSDLRLKILEKRLQARLADLQRMSAFRRPESRRRFGRRDCRRRRSTRTRIDEAHAGRGQCADSHQRHRDQRDHVQADLHRE